MLPTSTTCSPVSRRTPAAAYQGAVSSPTVGPSAATSGAPFASTTTTSTPAAAATPATSAPIHPAPITTSRAPGTSARPEPLGVGGGVQGQGRLPARRPDGVRAAGHDERVGAQCAVVGEHLAVARPTARARAPGCPGGPRPRGRAGRRRSRRRATSGAGGPGGAWTAEGGRTGRRPRRRAPRPARRTLARAAPRPSGWPRDLPDDEHVTGGRDRRGRWGRRGSGRSPRNGSLPSGGTSEMVKERMSGAAGVRRAAGAHPHAAEPRRRRPSRAGRAGSRPPPSTGPIPVEQAPLDPRAIARASLDAARNVSLWWTSSGIVVATVVALVVGTRAGAFVLAAVVLVVRRGARRAAVAGSRGAHGAGQGPRRRRARPARCGPGDARPASCRADRTHGRPGPRGSRASGSCGVQVGVSAP